MRATFEPNSEYSIELITSFCAELRVLDRAGHQLLCRTRSSLQRWSPPSSRTRSSLQRWSPPSSRTPSTQKGGDHLESNSRNCGVARITAWWQGAGPSTEGACWADPSTRQAGFRLRKAKGPPLLCGSPGWCWFSQLSAPSKRGNQRNHCHHADRCRRLPCPRRCRCRRMARVCNRRRTRHNHRR